MAVPQSTIVNIGLICAGIFLATLLILTLTVSYSFFIVLFSIYVVGCTSYVYAVLLMKKKELKNDISYTSASYISIFNAVFAFFIFIIALILMITRGRREAAFRAVGINSGSTFRTGY